MRWSGIIWTILLVGFFAGLYSIHFANADSVSATTTVTISAVVPGGGGGENPPTEVFFSGFAYPGSLVTVLKDGQPFGSAVASVNSQFDFLMSGLSGGTYLFSLSAKDFYNNNSTPSTYSVSVINHARTTITGIAISPTVLTDNSEVKQGDPITISGQGMQDSTVTIKITGYGTTTATTSVTTLSMSSGLYQYVFDTATLPVGSYGVSAKWSNMFAESPYSQETFIVVGKKNIKSFLIGDVNYDDRVDIADFSMTAFWYHRTLGPAFITPELERLNGDGVVTLADFSLMAYYWTG